MTTLKDLVRGILLALAHAARSRQHDRAIVLVYHKLAAVPPPDDPWTIAVATFERHLEVLDAEGFRDVSLRELESPAAPPRGRTALIAFDDGYRSAADLALASLRAAGRTASFFLVAGAMGGTSEWERAFGLRPTDLMTWDDARRLLEAGDGIGSHSMTHADLSVANDAAIEREVAGSREAIERALGVTVRSFGVPFGRDDGRADEHLVRAGYLAKFTNPLAANRTRALRAHAVIGVVQSDSVRAFRYHLSGAAEVLHLYRRARALLRKAV